MHRAMLRRSINICTNARDRRIRHVNSGHSEVGDLYGRMIGGQQKILGLDVAVDDAFVMSVAEACTDLFDVVERGLEVALPLANECLQITAGHVFENKVMKDRPLQIACYA